MAKVTGMVELKAALQALPEQLQNNVLRGAVRAAAKVIADEAKANCRSKAVADSIRISSPQVKDGVVSVRVETKGEGAYLAPWEEYGTAAHEIRRLSKSPKRSLVIDGRFVGPVVEHPGARPHPFLRPALDTRQDEAVAAAGRYIADRLAKEGLRLGSAGDEDDE